MALRLEAGDDHPHDLGPEPNLAAWRLGDGRIGYGRSEHLDQVIDGRPVAVDE